VLPAPRPSTNTNRVASSTPSRRRTLLVDEHMDGVDVVLVGPSLDDIELEAARSAMEQQMVGALEPVREQRPDVLLLDVQVPELPASRPPPG